jgi:aerobic-type carbon monoxide dehydrogenase small subunit (CoxS/CutS family)
MAEIINMTVNGITYKIACTGKESLLEILREHLDLTGTKEGCGYGVCGSCTVIVNGEAVTSCTLPSKDFPRKMENFTPFKNPFLKRELSNVVFVLRE